MFHRGEIPSGDACPGWPHRCFPWSREPRPRTLRNRRRRAALEKPGRSEIAARAASLVERTEAPRPRAAQEMQDASSLGYHLYSRFRKLLLRLVRMQCQFLHPPIRDFANINFVRVPAVNFVHRTELLQLFARRPKFAEDFPVQFHSVNFTVIHVRGAVR